MDDTDFPEVHINYDSLPPANPVFVDIAAKVAAEVSIADAAGQLPAVLQKISQSCNEKLVRMSLVKANDHPHGLIAMVVRKKLKKILPQDFKRPDVIQAIVKAGAWAAKDDQIWSLVYLASHYISDGRLSTDVERSGSTKMP